MSHTYRRRTIVAFMDLIGAVDSIGRTALFSDHRCLRSAFKIEWSDGISYMKVGYLALDICSENTLSKPIEFSRLRWVSNLSRMNNTRVPHPGPVFRFSHGIEEATWKSTDYAATRNEKIAMNLAKVGTSCLYSWHTEDPATNSLEILKNMTTNREQYSSRCNFLSNQNDWKNASVPLDYSVCWLLRDSSLFLLN